MKNLDTSKYEVVPIYVSKSGQWILGNSLFLKPELYKNIESVEADFPKTSLFESEVLKISKYSLKTPLPKIDVVIPAFHGTFGEDGKIQGLIETYNIAYVGCDTLASAIGMDKILQKRVFSDANIPQVKYEWVYKNQIIDYKPKNLKYPLFVKPANGGSSIGITKVKNAEELKDALEVASIYDRKIIIEESAEGFMEINISILGNSGSDLETSVCEQPVASREVLTFADKYQSNPSHTAGMASAKRIIPALIKKITSDKISYYAKQAFEALDGSGFARIDFLVSPDEKTIYINEINTLPGSFAFYLWEKSGLTFSKLLDKLIDLAQKRHAEKSKSVYTFSNNLLTNLGDTLKGGKLKG